MVEKARAKFNSLLLMENASAGALLKIAKQDARQAASEVEKTKAELEKARQKAADATAKPDEIAPEQTKPYTESIQAGREGLDLPGIRVTEDTAAVRRSVQNLLSTAYGERLFQPNIGASLRSLLFEPIDAITTFEMRDRILDTIRKHEPRIGSLFVDVISLPDSNSYDVTVEFGLKVTGEKAKFKTVMERIR